MTTGALHQVLLGDGRSPVALSFTVSALSATDATTYSFTAQSVGTAANNRFVIIAIGSRANAARSISTATIGGVNAVQLAIGNDTSGGADIAALYIAALSTGTTADISLTFSAQMLRCGIGVYRMVGAGSPTPHATMTDNVMVAGVLSGTINCPANGAIVGAAWGAGSGNQLAVWAGITEDYDIQPETTANDASGAHDAFATVQTGLTVSATITGVSPAFGGLAVASFGPYT